MNKLVTSLAMVMIGTGVVRGGEYHEHGGNLEREREREREDRTLSC
jgi:hypothetical protein